MLRCREGAGLIISCMYEFTADRKFIFHVNAGGQQKLVEFEDGNTFGVSIYRTSDKQIADTIRHSAMFSRGAIKETATVDDTDNKGSEPAAPETGKQKIFSNITQAKEWLNKEFGVSKRYIRSVQAVIDCAKEKGYNIILSKE